MKTACDVVERLVNHAKSIAEGRERVHPGQTEYLSSAAQIGEGIWQGDLCLEVAECPEDYVEFNDSQSFSGQLVPGNTEGARHFLSATEGVTVKFPPNWPEVTQLGPYFKAEKEISVLHPRHGHVVIPAGMGILCSYQREWDAEQKAERRNAD